MGSLYEAPPILEAVCEFRFESRQPWDWTVPGLVYGKVKAEYPKKRPQKIHLELGPEQPEPMPLETFSKMQFLREDETALIQVGPDLIAANHLKPYSTWRTFRKIIENAFSVYQEITDPKAIKRIGLRYINRIQTQEESVSIGDYLLALPQVPESIPQVFGKWVQRVEIPFQESNGVLALQSGSIHEPTQSGASFILDLDFFTLDPGKVTMGSALDWVERAHYEVEKTFEACITDKSRALFHTIKEIV